MIRTKIALAVGLGLVALLAVTPVANAKDQKGPRPDLVIGKVSKPPASNTVGSKLKVTVKVTNRGNVKAAKSRVALYLAKSKKHKAKDRPLKRAKVKALRPDKSAKAKLKLVLPASSTPGTYRLIACADDRKQVRESKEGDNCIATKAFKLKAIAVQSPPAPTPPAAPAFRMTDSIDWGFIEDANLNEPEPGDPVTATLSAANGIAGQAGYVRSGVASQPLVAGATTSFDYSGANNSEDDGAVTINLPFAFPFGGISESSVSIGTNGWMSFGSPALDYWDDSQTSDYRGTDAVVGNFERGIMPYWADLDVSDQDAGTGTIKEVVPADGSSVAFQWDIGQHSGDGTPRRLMQVVLFPDGRFRFDYLGENGVGGNKAFVGYSLGTGLASVDAVGTNVLAAPSSGLLFTPNPVAAGSALPAGQVTVTLPAGSSFVSGDAGCTVPNAPTPLSEGLASCPVPSLAAGQQATRTVSFAMPPNAPNEGSPPNFRYLGTYLSGGLTLSDGDEINALNTGLVPGTITVTPSYISPPPQVGMTAQFAAPINSTGSGLDEPRATFTLPANTTLNSIQISGQNIPCSPPSAGQVTCKLPSGTTGTEAVVTLTPSLAALGSQMTLGVSVQALNAPMATGSATSPPVLP